MSGRMPEERYRVSRTSPKESYKIGRNFEKEAAGRETDHTSEKMPERVPNRNIGLQDNYQEREH